MTPSVLRIAGAAVGALSTIVAGALAGGWWWAAGAAGAVAAIGGAVDRQLGLAQVLVTLLLAVGLAAADVEWFVPLLAAGTIGGLELGALADRRTVVRPRVDADGVLGSVALTVGVATTVLLASALPDLPTTAAVLGAAAAAVVAVRVIAR